MYDAEEWCSQSQRQAARPRRGPGAQEKLVTLKIKYEETDNNFNNN